MSLGSGGIKLESKSDAQSLTSEDEHWEPEHLGEACPEITASPTAITASPSEPAPDERSYCLAYPDIAAAIASGTVGSAEEHYEMFGRGEVEAGLRYSPYILRAPPAVTLPVIIALLGQATSDRRRPWNFLSRNEQALIDSFADVLFEKIYLDLFDDLREALVWGVIPSGFDHWLSYGRNEIVTGQRDVGSARCATRLPIAEMSARIRELVSAVTDWSGTLAYLARGVDYKSSQAQFDLQASAVTTSRALAHARAAPNGLGIHSDQWSGAEHLYGCTPRVVAFYLPQYHTIPENDAWWGPGFTEWTNVRKAKPNFEGHSQPHIPFDQHYYDLTDAGVQRRQTALAKEYGVTAFCYYMYWFDGRRVLERPLDQMVADKSIDHEFCICWANENWTRTWDGNSDDILLSQVHSAESDRRFISDALTYLADPRYLRVEGKLVLLVYRVDLLPNCRATAAIWRDEVRRAGLGELHLCAVQFYGITDPEPWGFDAAVEFPPHGWLVPENMPTVAPAILNPDFRGTILDYGKSVDWAASKPYPDYRWYRAAFPGWDNTARRQDTPHIFAFADPLLFEGWLTAILRQTIIMAPPEHQLVFVNAWNEWGEGAHLEPDERNGLLNLMALNSALTAAKREAWPLGVLGRLRRPNDYPGRAGDEAALLNLLRASENAFGVLTNQLRATGVNPFI